MELKKLMEHISIIPDYRQAWKVEHKLSDILLLIICAVVSGAEGWEDIEDFGETHLDFLKQYGDFENGIPVHDTIARVVSCISPAKFHECFINWMRDCHSSDDKDVIAIDGKTLRHSYDKSRRRGAIHVIKIRLHIVCDIPDELIDFTFEWKGLKKLCMAVSFRSIIAEQKKNPEMTVRYYISSADLTAEKFATAIRNHWHMENKLHWRLDVVMNEDDSKIRRGNAAELFSGIRHIAINILTNDKVSRAGLRRKMRKAAMDRNYLASVLARSGLS
ncbi:ISAs1 family transposase [Escherichia coli]|uniref:ISAs1 family transposase n=1 Tax=Escherichia coli TaxID=562 RepID=UPI0007E8FD81|nr:ISAs1 family transposase [Escherichia coli]EEV0896205.1 ISAs1 family transposase [Escherichia coli]EEZ8674452.1 ISAs1 family transposase [Escherichia coli]EFB2464500.1 ISAs1 family transposase [Escherichia coli]EFC6618970.1 ISAs1 family transposase [Escherichia coli]EFC6833597.1 ISAs1 family transposase [Escherichia coli]